MTPNRERMVDILIRMYGFENEIVIEFAKLAENESFPEDVLITLFNVHTENNSYNLFKEFQEKNKEGVDNSILI